MARKKLIVLLALALLLSFAASAATAVVKIHDGKKINVDDLNTGDVITKESSIYNNSIINISWFYYVRYNGHDTHLIRASNAYEVPDDHDYYDIVCEGDPFLLKEETYFVLSPHSNHRNEDGNCACDVCGFTMHLDSADAGCKCDTPGCPVMLHKVPSGSCKCSKCGQTNHGTLNYYPAQDPTCYSFGAVAHYTCSVCSAYFDTDHNRIKYYLTPMLSHTPNGKKEATAATCSAKGNSEYWTCKTCTQRFANEDCTGLLNVNETTIPVDPDNHAYTHSHHAAVAATCNAEGNIEYWTCEGCKKNFDNEACSGTPLSDAQIKTSKTDHTLFSYPAIASTCTKDGQLKYWRCTRESCGKLFLDASAQNETTWEKIIIPAAHTLSEETRVEPTCTTGGIQTYQYCSACSTYFYGDDFALSTKDEADLVIDKLGHDPKSSSLTTAPCPASSVVYWQCQRDDCGKYFTDEQCTTETEFDKIDHALAHDLGHVPTTDPTCTKEGKLEHWRCLRDGCGMLFSDEKATIPVLPDDLILSPDASNHPAESISEHASVAATCIGEGAIAYWHCSDCGKYYADKDLTTEIDKDQILLAPEAGKHLPQSITAHAASAPTCMDEGAIAYWHCSDCGKLYADAALTTLIAKEADTVLSAAGHKITIHHPKGEPTCTADGSEEFWSCSVCQAQFVDEAGSAAYIPGNPADALGHDWPDAYTVSETQHWLVCRRACGAVQQPGEHAFVVSIDKEPTHTEEGLQREVCSVCGYERSRSAIAMLIMPELPSTGDHSRPVLWLGAALVSLLALIGVRKEKHC